MDLADGLIDWWIDRQVRRGFGRIGKFREKGRQIDRGRKIRKIENGNGFI